MALQDLPLLNALLNSTSTVLLIAGYRFIRRRQVRKHRICMIAALTSSSLFLLSYVGYHLNVGTVHFTGVGLIRPVYFSILVSHTVLAATVPPLALVTFVRALRKRFRLHRNLARWTLPVWLYVSVTGVVIYILLYRIGTPG